MQSIMSNAPSKEWGRIFFRQLINHVSRHMNALQALTLNVPVQDLMLNNLMVATLDPETQREWQLTTVSGANTPITAELVTFLESRCRNFEHFRQLNH